VTLWGISVAAPFLSPGLQAAEMLHPA
jgi:hypothetical protein